MKQTIRFTLAGILILPVAYLNFQRGSFSVAANALFYVTGLAGGIMLSQIVLHKLPNELDARYGQMTKLIWVFISLIVPAAILNILCPISNINLGIDMFIAIPLVNWASEYHKLNEQFKARQNQLSHAATI